MTYPIYSMPGGFTAPSANVYYQTKTEKELAEKKRLETWALNQKIMAMYQNAIRSIRRIFSSSGGNIKVPSEYSQLAGLFQPGGPSSKLTAATAHQGAQRAISAGQIGLSQTGMSSGTISSALKARAEADRALAIMKGEAGRETQLAGALTTVGGAKLSAQEIASRKQMQLMQTLSSLQPRFISY